ncbi:MAG: hypothetical protein PHW63_11545 [Alphaproteobacteria bacterium]|nr:hypothetical protein [Alphaproteobacteria bacterium]
MQEAGTTAQRLAKQAIFSFHRADEAKGLEQLAEAREKLLAGKKLIAHDPRLMGEGVWRAALEEFCEASFFAKSVTGDDLFPPQDITEDTDILLGALSDLVGEMVRVAVNAAIERDKAKVEGIYEQAVLLVEFILSMDLTGGLRSKADQARQHLRRMEEIRYDLSKQ